MSILLDTITMGHQEIGVVAQIWSQMRLIRSIIQMRRHGLGIVAYSKLQPHACIAFIAALLSAIMPCTLTLLLTLASTLVYDFINAPIEVDNGGTLEWASSAMLFLPTMLGMISSGTGVDNSNSNYENHDMSTIKHVFGDIQEWLRFSFRYKIMQFCVEYHIHNTIVYIFDT